MVGNFEKSIVARNGMKCPDQYTKVIFANTLTPFGVGWSECTLQKKLSENDLNVQIYIGKSCFPAPPNELWTIQTFLARN